MVRLSLYYTGVNRTPTPSLRDPPLRSHTSREQFGGTYASEPHVSAGALEDSVKSLMHTGRMDRSLSQFKAESHREP